MCRLMGVSSEERVCINDFLKLFYAKCEQHPHGWGLACADGGEVTIEKESLKANQSHYLKERLSEAICVKAALAHIRYATIGNIDRKNCHPFAKKDNFFRQWVLIHNGTIFEYEPLSCFIKTQKGETDSERILLYLVKIINKAQKELKRALSFDERFELLDRTVTDMSKGNKLNLIIYDGEYMYVHSNYRNSLYSLEQEGLAVFSSEPLTNEDWQPVKFNTLCAYKNGELCAEGTAHGCEYIDDEESLKMLYSIFSNL